MHVVAREERLGRANRVEVVDHQHTVGVARHAMDGLLVDAARRNERSDGVVNGSPRVVVGNAVKHDRNGHCGLLAGRWRPRLVVDLGTEPLASGG